MEVIGSTFFDDSEDMNLNSSTYNTAETNENVDLQQQLLSFIPEKVKLDMLNQCFTKLIGMNKCDQLQLCADKVSPQMRPMFCLLKDFHLRKSLTGSTSSSIDWPPEYQMSVKNMKAIYSDLLTKVCIPMVTCTDIKKAVLSDVLQLSDFLVSDCVDTDQVRFIHVIIDMLDKKTTMDKKFLYVECLSQVYSRASEGICRLVENQMFLTLQKMLPYEDEPLVGNLLMVLIPKIMQQTRDIDKVLAEMWNAIKTCFDNVKEIELYQRRAFMLLCGLVDFFFPSKNFRPFLCQFLTTSAFWMKFQSGFLHSDQLTRKRTLYIFRTILASDSNSNVSGGGDMPDGRNSDFFRFDCVNQDKMANLWQDFLLLIETLEEKQVHLIQPVLNRFSVLLEATKKDSNGIRLLHVSWVILLFRRMASHESTTIRRWSMLTLLQADPEILTSDESGLEFLCGPFVEMLTDSSIFYRPPNQDPSEPSMHQALISFLCGIHQHLGSDRKSKFWTSFFETLSAHFWNGGILVYVSRAVAELPKCNVLGRQSVHHFRKLLTLAVLAHDSVFRSAIQCFLTKTFFNFIDLTQFDLDSLLVVIGCLSTSESLRRGNKLWFFLVDWLKNTDSYWQKDHLMSKLDALIGSWMQSTDDNISAFKENSSRVSGCITIVRLLLLVSDAGIPSSSGKTTNPIVDCLAVIQDIVASMNIRAYLSELKTHQAFLLFLSLLQELDCHRDSEKGSDNLKLIMIKRTSEFAEEVMLFFARKLMNISQISDYNPVPLYLELLKQMAQTLDNSLLCSFPAFQHLVEHCCSKLSNSRSKSATLVNAVCLEVVGVICSLLPSTCELSPRCAPLKFSLKKLVGSWTLKTELAVEKSQQEQNSLFLRHLRSGMLSGQWAALSWYFCSVGDFSSNSLDEFVAMASETIDIAGPDVLFACFEALCFILPKVTDDQAVKLLVMAWHKVQEYAHRSNFWSVYAAFVSLAFQKDFLQRDANQNISKFLGLCYCEILRKGEEKNGMLNVLVKRICSEMNECPDSVTFFANDLSLFEKSLAFGSVYDKAKRFHLEVQHYLHELTDHFSEEDLQVRVVREDALVRVELLSFLAHLDPSRPTQLHFGQSLAQHLVGTLRNLVTSHRRSYANCMTHRTKHRLLVSLLILEPFVWNGQEDLVSFPEFVIELISEETQPSVRFLGEWLFIRLSRNHPEARLLLFKAFENCSDKKPAVVCSLLVIIVHVAELLVSKDRDELSQDEKTEIFTKCFTSALSFCMSSNFNIRAYAQASLMRLWIKVSDGICDVLKKSECMLMENVHLYINNNRDTFWGAFQLLNNHYCFNFHPEKDFSLETLVYTVPRLTGMSDDEWLSSDTFASVGLAWKQCRQNNLPLTSDSDALRKCVNGGWKSKPSELAVNEERLTMSGNVQKKMIPWQSLIVEPDMVRGKSELSGDCDSSQKSDDGLVLVASLIDRIPNLGGLCRTCEIFAVSKFIIGSKRYLEDKEFEVLSVTSHKWINIQEVLPNNLITFLLEAKKAGYTLVGAEQAAKSCCLSQFKFPKKTLLLLGNERLGIPVHILQVLDICIEIPQSGMIRSLNVHVTGALLIWEYYKQWNLSNGLTLAENHVNNS